MKVLVADNDRISRELLLHQLTYLGFPTKAVEDGIHAWQEIYKEGGPNIVILNWTLPGLSGLEICERIRAQPIDRYVYVILLVPLDIEDHIVQGIRAGADDFLSKPYRVNELRLRVGAGLRVTQAFQIVRKENEVLRQQAQCQAEQLASICDNLPLLVVGINQHDVITRCNPAAKDILNPSDGEVVGSSIFDEKLSWELVPIFPLLNKLRESNTCNEAIVTRYICVRGNVNYLSCRAVRGIGATNANQEILILGVPLEEADPKVPERFVI